MPQMNPMAPVMPAMTLLLKDGKGRKKKKRNNRQENKKKINPF